MESMMFLKQDNKYNGHFQTYFQIIKNILETLKNGRGFLSCLVAQGIGKYSIVVGQILAVADSEGHASPTSMQRIIFAGKIDE